MNILRFITGSLFAVSLLIAACNHASGQTTAVPARVDDAPKPDIVVTGRRSRVIQAKDVTDSIPAQTIKGYAADSIGELLNRLSARFGPNFSILVNGRRLAAVDAVNALPPEALERIEVLTRAKGREYGLPAGAAVINLALRPRFAFATVEGAGSITTDGVGDTENGAGRYSRIRKENRFNMALAYNRQGGIRESDRIAPEISDSVSAYRSVAPRQSAVTLTTGYSRPLGSVNLDLSSEISLARTATLTGVFSSASGASGETQFNASTQQTEDQSVRSGATLSGNAGQYFWTALVNGEINWSSVGSRLGPAIKGISSGGGLTAVLGPDVRTRTTSVGATVTSGGPFFTLPTGAATVDGAVSVRLNSLASSVAHTAEPTALNRYTATTAQAGITVPIALRGVGLLGFLGDLSLSQRFGYSQNSGIGAATTSTSSFDWNPAPSLLIAFSHVSSPGIADAATLYAPVVSRPGVLIYDALSSMIVPVTIISGGRSDIAESRSSSTSIQATYQTVVPFANVSASVNYTTTQTLNPLVTLSNPSPLAQMLIPELFVRDAAGKIIEFDSRPFSGSAETDRVISVNLHLNGPAPKMTAATPANGRPIVFTASKRPSWDLNLSYGYALGHRLDLGGSKAEIDLLATPLSLSSTGSSRHRLTVQWAVGKENFGLNGTISWESGSSVRSLDDEAGSTVRYSSLTKIGVEGFVELDRSPDADNPKSLRLKLGIDNLFNQRLRVSGLSGFNASSQNLLNDPYGRIIRLTVRKSL